MQPVRLPFVVRSKKIYPNTEKNLILKRTFWRLTAKNLTFILGAIPTRNDYVSIPKFFIKARGLDLLFTKGLTRINSFL